MSDQVLPTGPGWGVRAGRNDTAAAPASAAPTQAQVSSQPALAAHADGRWIAGVGWVAATHPYATGEARLPKAPKRRRGGMGIMPAGPIGRIVAGLAGSATAGIILFSVFGWHSWITDIFHGSHDVSTPASIGGDPLVISGPVAQLSQQVDQFMTADPIVEKSAGGFYAAPGATSPAYAVFGIKHRGASLTQGDMTDIVNHISSGSYGSTLDTKSFDGVTYTCGQVDLGGRMGVACIWDDYNVGGFLVSFNSGDVPSVMALTRIARNAIEGTTSAPSTSSTSSR